MHKFSRLIFTLFTLSTANGYAETPNHYMQEIIKIARTQPQNPFAAEIVNDKSGKVLCQGLNDSLHHPAHHGEMVAMNNCVKQYPHINWSETTLYTTAEPCPMCEAAIMWAGIPKVVYGTSIPSLKKFGWDYIDIRAKDVAQQSNFYHGEVVGGVLSIETDKLFKKTE